MPKDLQSVTCIRLLSRLRIEKEDVAIEGFRTQKTLALLAYLEAGPNQN